MDLRNFVFCHRQKKIYIFYRMKGVKKKKKKKASLIKLN